MHNNSSYPEIVLQNMFMIDGALISKMIVDDGQIKNINALLDEQKNNHAKDKTLRAKELEFNTA